MSNQPNTNIDCSPDCELCGGYGFVRSDITDIHDPMFGKIKICPNREKLIWQAKIGISQDEAGNLDWTHFAVRKSSTQIKRALSILLSRCYGFLYLFGSPGTGKTLMSKSATLLAQYQRHMNAHYTTQSIMSNALRASYDEDDGQTAYKRLLDWYCHVRWLVIDEIGRDRRNEFSKAVLSDILNERYNGSVERKAQVTVLVSNFAPVEVLDDYQLDRVKDSRSSVLEIKDFSFRALPVAMFEEQKQEIDKLWWQKL